MPDTEIKSFLFQLNKFKTKATVNDQLSNMAILEVLLWPNYCLRPRKTTMECACPDPNHNTNPKP